VDNVALVRVTGEQVGADLAKGTGKDPAVEVIHHGMDFGFGGRNTSLGVAVGGFRHDERGFF
jgi:hypothetical protein